MHRSVLLAEAIEALALKPGARVIDATINGGGHSGAICERIGERGILIGIDRDREALERSRARLKDAAATVHLLLGNFADMEALAASVGVRGADAILFDLGLSSDQLEGSGRGFSFKRDEPLLMTFSADPKAQPFTARDIVNDWSEETIANVIFGYGEEKAARRIAERIVEARTKHPIETTSDLADLIASVVRRCGPLHPATKTFQALRIAVNDELGSLERGLRAAENLIAPRGRIAVISFHSLEDRIVKNHFSAAVKKGTGRLLVKKPLRPSASECAENPRARSAKLRIFERL